MKKLISLLLAVLMLTGVCSAVGSAAAASDFIINGGVLMSYTGSDSDVVLPDEVTVIGESAFEGNTAIQSVTLPSSVYTIGDRAFCGCTALSEVIGGGNVSDIGVFAFRDTPYYDSSTEKYTTLGHVLLWYNGTSESVSIPFDITAVAPYAFARCETLRSFRSDGSLVRIGTGAFYDCEYLESVDLPPSVSEIGAYAFDGTPYLAAQGDFPTLGNNVLVKYQGSDSNITIPSGVRRIASGAFMGLSYIESVSFCDSVYAIDPYAFADCVNLTEITLNEGLMMIGDGAFRGCKSLTTVATPSTMSYIGQFAFNGDASLDTVAINGDDLTVSYNAFKGCSGLRAALLGIGVIALYDGAFNGCSGLEGISIPADTTTIGSKALVGCSQVTVSCPQYSVANKTLSSYGMNTVLGNVNEDGELNVMDATAIQCYAARCVTFTGAQIASADFNFDTDVNVIDATLIQMTLAGLI